MGKRPASGTPPSAKALKTDSLGPRSGKMLSCAKILSFLWVWVQLVKSFLKGICENFGILRSFDPLQAEHPVSWLLSHMDDNLYPALFQWVKEIMATEPPDPSSVNMPD